MEENSDLSDIQKIELVLCGDVSSRENESEYFIHYGENGEGYSPSEASSYQQHLTPNVDNSFSIFEDLTLDPTDEDRRIIDDRYSTPCRENAIAYNRAYHQMLMDLCEELQAVLDAKTRKQEILKKEIEILKANKTNKKTDKQKKKLIPFSYFGMPYFKDAAYNTPPPNGEVILAESLEFRNISLILLNKSLSKFDVRKLRKGIREQATAIEFKRLGNLRNDLEEQKKNPSVSEDEVKDIKSRIKSVEQEIYVVHSLPDDKLCDIPPETFDWHQISVQIFGRTRTPDQLRLHWMHYLRPGVDTSSWTHNQSKLLKEVVSKYENGVDWNEVATKISNRRTPFDCFRRYQEKFNDKSRKFGWSDEDNMLLFSLVRSFKTDHISDIYWEEIRQNFPGRSRSQIYAHFRYHLHSLDPSPFSAHEDTAILEGIKIGFSLADISLLLGKRSIIQIRNRFKSLMKKPRPNEKDWTEDEDKRLMEMPDVGQLRGHTIRKDYPGRSFSQLFSRYHYLRMQSTTPKQYIAQLKDQRLYSEARYLPKENRKIASQIVNMMSRNGYDRDVNGSLLKRLPMLKINVRNDYEERNRKKRSKYCTKLNNQRAVRGKRVISRKEKELKQILRPYMASNTKRPRKLCFPGDGREHGIVLSCLYRLLQCDFSLAPTIDEDFDPDKAVDLGIAYENYLPFKELMAITKDIPVPENSVRIGNEKWLPASLATLMGYRGLELHRNYLESSAKLPLENVANSNELVEDDEDDSVENVASEPDEDDPMEGPSGQSEPVRKDLEVEIPGTSASNEQIGENDPQNEDKKIFGDKIADGLLFTRMMTLFYWPGIMSSMYVPDLTREEEPQEAAEDVPELPPKKVKNKTPNKKNTKLMRRDHLRQVALKRHGKCRTLNDSAVSTTSAEDLNNSASAGPSEADEADATPPKKKAKKTPAKVKVETPKSDRVTRRSKQL